jgi:hypothetical protein
MAKTKTSGLRKKSPSKSILVNGVRLTSHDPSLDTLCKIMTGFDRVS